MKNPYTCARIAVARGMNYEDAMRWYTQGAPKRRKRGKKTEPPRRRSKLENAALVRDAVAKGGTRKQQLERARVPRATFYRHLATLELK